MNLIASYPIQENMVLPHCGKPVVAITRHGDRVVGLLDSVRDGHVIFKPLQHQANVSVKKAKTKQFGFGGYGYGYGYGARSIALPLFVLAALLTFPFFI